MTARFLGKGSSMLWSALQIALLVYIGLAALIYFKQSSLVFLPEMDRGFRASPADIGLPFTPLSLATADGETAMQETSAIGWITCACSMILDSQP
jgi:hypothetical protein